MTMIFERDDKGLLHQVDTTLEDVAAAGRNINMVMAQQFFVLFTSDEETKLAEQRAEARRIENELKSEALKAEEARQKAIAAEQDRLAAIEQAKLDAQAAKDNALALALQKLTELQDKVDKLSSKPS
jgi:uncharacterized membrane protein YqiK